MHARQKTWPHLFVFAYVTRATSSSSSSDDVKQMGQEAALSPPFDAIVLFDVLVDRLLVSWVVHSMSPLQLGRFNLSPIETVITLR